MGFDGIRMRSVRVWLLGFIVVEIETVKILETGYNTHRNGGVGS